MPTPARPSLLRRLIGLPSRPAPRDDDAADMGTAIGLDYSLDQASLAKPAPAGKVPAARPWARRRGS